MKLPEHIQSMVDRYKNQRRATLSLFGDTPLTDEQKAYWVYMDRDKKKVFSDELEAHNKYIASAKYFNKDWDFVPQKPTPEPEDQNRV